MLAAISNCRYLQPSQTLLITERDNKEIVSQAKQRGSAVHFVDRGLDACSKRAAGAERAEGDVLLFIDSGQARDGREFLKWVEPVLYGGAAAAFLHRKSVYESRSSYPSVEAVWAASWNRMIGRDDLQASSLTATPFALSGQAVRSIGAKHLNNPVAFYTLLLRSRMRIAHPAIVSEKGASAAGNIFHPRTYGSMPWELSAHERRVVDFYLQAMSQFVPKPRGGFTDGGRRRDIAARIAGKKPAYPIRRSAVPLRPSALYGGKKLSVVIPARNEEATIEAVIRELRMIEPAEIIVVVNGSKDRTAEKALQSGASVVTVPEALGTDTGRAVGALYATGDILLFVDGEPVIAAENLYPFALAVQRGVDIALNDPYDPADGRMVPQSVAPSMFALNAALNQKRLGAASMVMIPFAISRRALGKIGWEALLCPPRALAAGVMHGLDVKSVHRVNVEKDNRMRREKHVTGLASQQIIGDHVEALHHVLKKRGR